MLLCRPTYADESAATAAYATLRLKRVLDPDAMATLRPFFALQRDLEPLIVLLEDCPSEYVGAECDADADSDVETLVAWNATDVAMHQDVEGSDVDPEW